MRQKPTRPAPTPKKSVRQAKTDWDLLEAMELQSDAAARARKLAGPSPEALKLLNKNPKTS